MSEKSELSGGVFLQTPYMVYLKDPVAGILCSQIHYWYTASKHGNSKLRVYKQGDFWIAKSRREWTEETGLTDAQVKRGLDVLVRKGIIEKMVTLFNGAPTMHIRAIQITAKVLKDGEYLVPNVVGKISPVQITNPLVTDAESLALQHQPLVSDDQSITESTQKISTKNTQYSLASEDAETFKVEKQKQQPEENIYSEVVSMVDVEKKDTANNSPEPTTSISSHEVWHQLTQQQATEYGEFLPLGKKELAQLKQVSQRLGDRTEPVLRLVFEKWIGFGKYAKTTYAAFPIPDVPTIGFILKYAQAALNYWNERAAPKHAALSVGASSTKTMVPAIAVQPDDSMPARDEPPDTQQTKNGTEQSPCVKEEERPATLEDILGMQHLWKKKADANAVHIVSIPLQGASCTTEPKAVELTISLLESRPESDDDCIAATIADVTNVAFC